MTQPSTSNGHKPIERLEEPILVSRADLRRMVQEEAAKLVATPSRAQRLVVWYLAAVLVIGIVSLFR